MEREKEKFITKDELEELLQVLANEIDTLRVKLEDIENKVDYLLEKKKERI